MALTKYKLSQLFQKFANLADNSLYLSVLSGRFLKTAEIHARLKEIIHIFANEIPRDSSK